MRRTAILLVALLLAGCAQQQAAPTPSPSPSPSPVGSPTTAYVPLPDPSLMGNSLYKAGQVDAVRCTTPTARLATKQAIIRYATAFVRCLDRAWAPVLQRVHFSFSPVVAVYSAPTGSKSGCGVMESKVAALYCDETRSIYFNWPRYIVKEAQDQEGGRASVQYLMAHEYGHHVQQLTGLTSGYAQKYWAAEPDAQRGEQDRHEMQAHCFAAAFFGANRETLRLKGERLAQFGHPGYTPSGSADHFLDWLERGFAVRGPRDCNTWTMPAAASNLS